MLLKRNDDLEDYSLSKLETIQSATVSKNGSKKIKKNPTTFIELDDKYHDLLKEEDQKDLVLSQEKNSECNKNSIIAKQGEYVDSSSIDTNQVNKSIYDRLPETLTKIIKEIPKEIKNTNNQLAILPTKIPKNKLFQVKKRQLQSSLFDDKGYVKNHHLSHVKSKDPKQAFNKNFFGINNLGNKSNQNVDMILNELFKMFKKQNIQINHEHFIRNLIEQGLFFYFGNFFFIK
jgi:hypothetical protein